MYKTTSAYKRLFASLLAIWMGLIVVSGIVFMHKEVTSKGEIVTHIHPYDFTKKTTDKHTHQSDAEIQFLNILFHGNFVEIELQGFVEPFFQSFFLPYSNFVDKDYIALFTEYFFLRGPPYYS